MRYSYKSCYVDYLKGASKRNSLLVAQYIMHAQGIKYLTHEKGKVRLCDGFLASEEKE